MIMVIIALCFNASSGVAIKIPLFILGDYEIDKIHTEAQIDEGRNLMQRLMFFLFGLMILLCIPPILFFKDKAPTPPSYTASDV